MVSLLGLNEKYKFGVSRSEKIRIRRQAEIAKLESEIERIENRKTMYPDFEKIFRPLAEEIKNKIGADRYEFYGPFGLNCERFYKVDAFGEKILGSISFVHRNDAWALRNYAKKVNDYANGSIAEMNGDNYEVIKITEEMTIEWILRFIKREVGEHGDKC